MEDINNSVNSVEIRKAVHGDGERIIALLEQIGEYHHNGRPDIFKSGIKKYNLDHLIEILDNPQRITFSAADKTTGEILGYALCEILTYKNHPIFNDMMTFYIDDICVDEKCRGQGIGFLLVEKCKEYAKETGCYNIDLNVWEFNQSAIKFYEKCGLVVQRRKLEFILI